MSTIIWKAVRSIGWARFGLVAIVVASTVACSPGTLPGSPSPLQVGGGGARYNGSITYRRIGGGLSITEAAQTLSLSVVVRDANQITGRFESGESSGSLQGTLSGDLASGSFQATILLSTIARQGATSTTCEGRGDVSGTLAGRSLTWTSGSITYDGACQGLVVSSQAQAVAVSPVPGESPDRANVIVTVLGGANVRRGTCPGGEAGYPFTVEIAETAGVALTFDSTFLVEERRNFGAATSNELDMPFRELSGGSRRRYDSCSTSSGTYQAFFSGVDANSNRFRVGSPVVTFVP